MKSHIVKKVRVKILDFNLLFGPFPKTQWYLSGKARKHITRPEMENFSMCCPMRGEHSASHFTSLVWGQPSQHLLG